MKAQSSSTKMKNTTCETSGCGAMIKYRTRKPKYCPSCQKKRNEGKPKVYRSRKSIPQRSKKELEVQHLMTEILPKAECITNGYYSWLLSPKKQPMQLDIYFPALKLAIEYDGKQHYVYTPYMHSSLEAFTYLQTCDQLKDKNCADHGITMIRVKFDRKISKAFLVRRLQGEGVLDKLKELTFVNDMLEEETK